jgi:polyphenol oxidase
VSRPPYDELNLGTAGADDPEAVRENLRRVAAAFNGNGTLARMRQVHGADVAVVAGGGEPPVADGVVTTSPGLALMVRVADCAPVLLADPDAGVVAAVHAGRPGLVAGVVPATVERMRAVGATRLVAWLGPHVCRGCYEVPRDMRDSVAAVVPQARAETSWGTPSVDIGAGLRAQLEAADVEVVDASRCTRESADLYSYRRDSDFSGRFAGLVRIRP